MNYAIIKSGNTSLLEVVKLSNWESWEWKDFSVVRDQKTGDIEWFDEENEAIDFMLKYFDKEIINPKYSNTSGYFIG